MNYEYCDGMTHTVKQGETLYSLSRQYNVPLAIILRANPYIDVYNLQIGDTICIPVKNQGQQGNGSCTGCKNMGVMPGCASSDNSMARDNMDNMDYDNNDNGNGMDNRNIGMKVDMDMPGSMDTDMDTDMDTGMDTGNGIQDNNGNGMYPMGNMRGTDGSNEGMWVKYVAQAGDTLQDILDRSACTLDMFWEKNQADKMYILPGVAYFILENNVE